MNDLSFVANMEFAASAPNSQGQCGATHPLLKAASGGEGWKPDSGKNLIRFRVHVNRLLL